MPIKFVTDADIQSLTQRLLDTPYPPSQDCQIFWDCLKNYYDPHLPPLDSYKQLIATANKNKLESLLKTCPSHLKSDVFHEAITNPHFYSDRNFNYTHLSKDCIRNIFTNCPENNLFSLFNQFFMAIKESELDLTTTGSSEFIAEVWNAYHAKLTAAGLAKLLAIFPATDPIQTLLYQQAQFNPHYGNALRILAANFDLHIPDHFLAIQLNKNDPNFKTEINQYLIKHFLKKPGNIHDFWSKIHSENPAKPAEWTESGRALYQLVLEKTSALDLPALINSCPAGLKQEVVAHALIHHWGKISSRWLQIDKQDIPTPLRDWAGSCRTIRQGGRQAETIIRDLNLFDDGTGFKADNELADYFKPLLPVYQFLAKTEGSDAKQLSSWIDTNQAHFLTFAELVDKIKEDSDPQIKITFMQALYKQANAEVSKGTESNRATYLHELAAILKSPDQHHRLPPPYPIGIRGKNPFHELTTAFLHVYRNFYQEHGLSRSEPAHDEPHAIAYPVAGAYDFPVIPAQVIPSAPPHPKDQDHKFSRDSG